MSTPRARSMGFFHFISPFLLTPAFGYAIQCQATPEGETDEDIDPTAEADKYVEKHRSQRRIYSVISDVVDASNRGQVLPPSISGTTTPSIYEMNAVDASSSAQQLNLGTGMFRVLSPSASATSLPGSGRPAGAAPSARTHRTPAASSRLHTVEDEDIGVDDVHLAVPIDPVQGDSPSHLQPDDSHTPNPQPADLA